MIMPDFVKVANKKDINEGEIREFEVNGQAIAIANLNGEYKAVANECTHDGGTLGEGKVVGGCCVECPRHGARFDLSTGAVKAMPATMPIKIFEVKVEGDDILVKV